MAEKLKGSVGSSTEPLLASSTIIKVNNNIVGYVTGASYQIANSVNRIIQAGKRTTKPISGQNSVLLNLRGLVITKPEKKGQTILPTNELIESITINNLTFEKCRLTSANLTVQSGQVLVYQEASFECENVSFK